MFRYWQIWSRRVAPALALLVLATGCSGHNRLSTAIDDLDLPGDFVEVAEMRDGPGLNVGSDYPRVSKFYLSQNSPQQTCETMRIWSSERGLSEEIVPDDTFVSCRFSGAIDSNQISILVMPPLTDIPALDPSADPIPIDVEHEAVVEIGMY